MLQVSIEKGFLEILYRLTSVKGKGPSPSFSHLDVCRVLLAVGSEGPLGRKALTTRLALGEGVVRTVIRHLTDAGLISISRSGCMLSRKGKKLFYVLTGKIPRTLDIDARQFSLDKSSKAILVKDAANLVKIGLEQRDAAVKAGATGAVTLIFRDGKFLMPMGEETWELDSQDPLARELDRGLSASDNDVIIIVSAGSPLGAEHGALAAAFTLLA